MTNQPIIYSIPQTSRQHICFAEDTKPLGDWPGKPETDRKTLLHVLWLRYAKVMTREEIAVKLDLPVTNVGTCLTEIQAALDEVDPEDI
ncbi:RNA polymerase sigma factor [Roseibium alexandrii]|uniref:Uncharacterized protein n=1 Tax=Roseibium alexandrii (strain DSM 17067 / NCIMB 14079 / DFL-11) TaxID=244592 RepID=A0A5E8H1R1_ROSAD|nr:hypothetical protein [Roseibium alexandrii]EEE45755.1 hypothetical protein SADFL11_3044 [Roseibium alexandrii DFL-11]